MNKSRIILSVCMMFCVYFTTISAASAEWSDVFKIFTGDPDQSGSSVLTDGEIISGLKEALSKGTKSAISNLGRPDGYFKNPRVRIPLPESLENIESGLRKLGQDEAVDEFILSMNRAAEQAVPEAVSVFADAIQAMSFDDARKILQGPDNAATQYFKRSSKNRLADKMLPIVQKSTSAVGITAKYKNMVDKLGAVSGLMDMKSLDLDKYVTDKALDGLFKMLADEEKLIRTDPAARTTNLLKKVFGN